MKYKQNNIVKPQYKRRLKLAHTPSLDDLKILNEAQAKALLTIDATALESISCKSSKRRGGA